MRLEDMLRNRTLMMKLFWLGFISSLVLMGIGAIMILLQLFS